MPSRVVATDQGLRVTYAHPHLPDSNFEMGWDDVDGVSVYALEDGSGVGRYLSFEHENGEFMEIHSGMVGWDEVVASLDQFLRLEVPSLAAVLETVDVDDPPVTVVSRRR